MLRIIPLSLGCLLAVALVLFSPVPSGSQDRGIVVQRSVSPETKGAGEQRVALVIGNGAYAVGPLRNPVNDARTMAVTLKGLGFDVTERVNLDQKEMKKEIQTFGERLQKGGVGLFYYAGHGMQVAGRNFLIPIGAHIEHEKQVEYESVDVGAVLAEMDNARNRLNIVILDACRDNPFTRSFRSSAQGLASVNAPSGTLIAYATAPGSVANDGEGEHGLYTGELIKVMQSPGLKVEDVFKQVRASVRETTQGKQVPWESSSMEGDFYFKTPPPPVVPVAPAQPAESPLPSQPSQESPAVGIPDNPTTVPPGSVSPSSRGDASVGRTAPKVWKEPVTGMEFVWVPGGCFLMGSPQRENFREADEGPVHEVCVDSFWMGKTEVTNGQFRKFQPKHDSRDYQGHSLNGETQPVVYVSWKDGVDFADWLKAQNGGQHTFRLPSEAEWEYACRAGTEGSCYWGDDASAACTHENVADQTAQRQWGGDSVHDCDDGYAVIAPTGTFQPNRMGLHDMLGNVMEWCADAYAADAYSRHDHRNPALGKENATGERVIRGGSWHGGPGKTRCAMRGAGLPGGMNDDLGFRLVREP